jgi:hypothetical protein
MTYTVVDTDILIDAGRGVSTAIDYLEEVENRTLKLLPYPPVT